MSFGPERPGAPVRVQALNLTVDASLGIRFQMSDMAGKATALPGCRLPSDCETMVSLLALENGGCSLEFAVEDIGRVRDALTARYGLPRVKRFPVQTIYTFGEIGLIFQHEWDAPCLIANNPEGAALLRAVADDLGESKAA